MTTKTNKITIDDILQKKKLVKDYSVFKSKYFGKEFELETIKPAQLVEIMNSDEDEITRYCKLIYNSCSFFRKKELIEALEVEIPYLTVAETFGDNYAGLFEFGNFIMEKYGFIDEETVNKVKKQF